MPKVYSLLKDNSEHIKQKVWIKITKSTISHNEYEDVLLNYKCKRHSMKRIQSKEHIIGTYEINKSFLSCFYNKIYIQNNNYHWLVLGYQS